jgi:hypothetical protein
MVAPRKTNTAPFGLGVCNNRAKKMHGDTNYVVMSKGTIATLTLQFGTRTGQNSTAALVQVFMDQGTTTGGVVLWIASLQRFNLN